MSSKRQSIGQNVRDTVTNGPVAETVKNQTAKAQSEFSDLADARVTPDTPAATGQPLTHYHSMFYRLLSWKNPRATGISFAVCVIFIFMSRYLNIIRYMFKGLYIILGVTALAEVAGKATLGHGLTSQMRPRKYYIIPKASLERFLDDAEQLINFFVIETQRVIFAENVYVTVASFFASLVSYFLIKFVPLWGLTLISTCVIFLGPLVYLQNKEIIDAQIQSANNMVSQQANQFKDLAAQHTGRASETLRTYAGEYAQKAQGMVGGARNRAPSGSVKKEDFPAAPSKSPASPVSPGREKPLVEM